MQRRTLIRTGLAGAVVLAVVGGGRALWHPGWRRGRLGTEARRVFQAVGLAVLDGLLPPPGLDRDVAMTDWLQRLDALLARLAPATRDELSQLLGLLSLGAGRRWLTGLAQDWGQSSTAEVAQALHRMRYADQPLRQQAYHALRDLSMAAFFSAPQQWTLLGYPGPVDV